MPGLYVDLLGSLACSELSCMRDDPEYGGYCWRIDGRVVPKLLRLGLVDLPRGWGRGPGQFCRLTARGLEAYARITREREEDMNRHARRKMAAKAPPDGQIKEIEDFLRDAPQLLTTAAGRVTLASTYEKLVKKFLFSLTSIRKEDPRGFEATQNVMLRGGMLHRAGATIVSITKEHSLPDMEGLMATARARLLETLQTVERSAEKIVRAQCLQAGTSPDPILEALKRLLYAQGIPTCPSRP